MAVCGNKIAAVGPSLTGHDLIDLQGAFVAPGLIDAHVHIESSLCTPPQFAAAVAVRGVTSVVTDPHEIANVVGPAGVRYMAEASKGLPLHVVVMGPSCVPATHMATAGGVVTADDLAALFRDGTILGLAEAMNFPGVIGGGPADARQARRPRRPARRRPRAGHQRPPARRLRPPPASAATTSA